jgi:hypothetical protein
VFDANSRYAKQPTYSVKSDGRVVTAVSIPLPAQPVLAGYHPRAEGERLDLIAGRYLKDATRFWLLCDLANGPSPAALAARDLIGVPRSGAK